MQSISPFTQAMSMYKAGVKSSEDRNFDAQKKFFAVENKLLCSQSAKGLKDFKSN